MTSSRCDKCCQFGREYVCTKPAIPEWGDPLTGSQHVTDKASHTAAPYTNMGHTVMSQRMVTDRMLAELRAYGRALRPENRKILDELLAIPLQHVGSITYASSMDAWAFLLLSIIIEQEKRLRICAKNQHER